MGMRLDPKTLATILATPGTVVGPTAGTWMDRAAAEIVPTFASEAEFQNAVVKLAKSLGWEAWHCYDSRKSAAGWPDLALVRPPRLLLWELKAEKGKLSAEQKKWLCLLRRCDGVEADVFWPRDWDRIVGLLR